MSTDVLQFLLCCFRLHFSPKSTNGGNLVVKNYDLSGSSFSPETKYYTGLTLNHTASYVFDFDPPYHCLTSCTSNPLDVSVSYTREVSHLCSMLLSCEFTDRLNPYDVVLTLQRWTFLWTVQYNRHMVKLIVCSL